MLSWYWLLFNSPDWLFLVVALLEKRSFVGCRMALLLLCFSIVHSIDLFMYGSIGMCNIWMIVYAVDNFVHKGMLKIFWASPFALKCILYKPYFPSWDCRCHAFLVYSFRFFFINDGNDVIIRFKALHLSQVPSLLKRIKEVFLEKQVIINSITGKQIFKLIIYQSCPKHYVSFNKTMRYNYNTFNKEHGKTDLWWMVLQSCVQYYCWKLQYHIFIVVAVSRAMQR